jgi:hypothetical protein
MTKTQFQLKKFFLKFLQKFQKTQVKKQTIYYSGQSVKIPNYKPTTYNYNYFKIKDIELDNCSIITNNSNYTDWSIYSTGIENFNYNNYTDSFYCNDSCPSTIIDYTEIDELISLYEKK